MSDADPTPHAETAMGHPDDHAGGTGGHDDDHDIGHEHEGEGEALGRIDLLAWGSALLGIAAGGVTAFAIALSTGYL